MTRPVDTDKIVQAYQSANARLIILDYDGTLVPFEIHPAMATPSVNIKDLVHTLALDRRNRVVLSSGRDKENLEAFWGDVPIVLMAEHGAYVMDKNIWGLTSTQSADWIPQALKALNLLVFKYEGSFVEVKSFSLAWHYRAISHKIKPYEKKQIELDLLMLARYADFQVYHCEDTIELRTKGIDKGSTLINWVGNQKFDFILALGDSLTDEDIFKTLPKNAFSIKIGESDTSGAQLHLSSQQDVLPFLQRLTKTEPHQINQSVVLNN